MALARHSGRLLTKRELLDLVWPESFVEEGILAVHVSNLRKALGDRNHRRRYIETVSRSGYRFIGRVSEKATPVPSRWLDTNRSPSIAVLPFENMSGDKENEYFSDGRTSAFAFKGKHEDVRRIAKALDVGAVLEGSVRRAGRRIRVTAQLITGVVTSSPPAHDEHHRAPSR